MKKELLDLVSSWDSEKLREVDRLLIPGPSKPSVPSLLGFVAATSTWGPLDPWQEDLCRRLEVLRHERGRRILIHAPPQFGKSCIISQRLPAWILGWDPKHRVKLACYNIERACRFSNTVLSLMRSPEYAAPFPSTGLPKVCSAKAWPAAPGDRFYYAVPTALGELLVDHANIRGDYLWRLTFDCSTAMQVRGLLVFGSSARDPEIQVKVNGSLSTYTATQGDLGRADLTLGLKQGRNSIVVMSKSGSHSVNLCAELFHSPLVTWVNPHGGL